MARGAGRWEAGRYQRHLVGVVNWGVGWRILWVVHHDLGVFNELFLNPPSFGFSFSPSVVSYRSTPAPFLTPSYGREILEYQDLKVLRRRSDGMKLTLNLPTVHYHSTLSPTE